MKSNKFRYILIIIFTILLIIEIFLIDYSDFWKLKNFLRFPAPILMILAMILSIRHTNKENANK
jgi:hypothetical protein